jgi:hypothetical protein
MSWTLNDVEWAYPETVREFTQTPVPGVVADTDAWPAGSVLPEQMLDYGRQVQKLAILEEHVGDEKPTGEAISFTGRVRYLAGEAWWEFSTISSYAWTGWVGMRDGYVTTTEMLED